MTTPYPTPFTFISKLEHCWKQENFVCVGLDSAYEQLPKKVKSGSSIEEALFVFTRDIIDATYDLVCAYKPMQPFTKLRALKGFRR